MEYISRYLYENDAYVRNLARADSRYRRFQDEGPQGIMLHSVGYPQPDANPIITSWNKSGKEKAVHAFIQPDVVYQTLPWNYRAWHAGGNANNTHIGVEMTEPPSIRYSGGSNWVDLDPKATEAFVRNTYANAVALFADLCKEFNLNPMADGVIISHAEGYKRGIASNHGDPEHLWCKFGLSMAQFRKDVSAAMNPAEKAVPALYRVQAGAFRKRDYAEARVFALKAAGFDACIVCEQQTGRPSSVTCGHVKVASSLNIRSGPGMDYDKVGKLKNGDAVTLVEQRNGWGQLLQGGWVSLTYIV